MTTSLRFPFRPTGLVAALMASGLLVALPAGAQQAPAPAATGDSKATELDPVVITVNKRLEKQREVAGTVSVLNGGDLERRGARDQEDALKLTPGVQFNKGDSSSNTITIRGIGTSTTNEGGGGQQGPTGSYLEDVPLAAPQGKGVVLDPVTWDLDRVEVLRGPQGVLFGSGSLGGALRYLFNKPRMNDFEGAVKAEYAKASHGEGTFSLFGMVNAPIAPGMAALRVAAFDRRDPGYIDNLGTGTKDANDIHQTGGRVLVTVKPVNGLSATLVASTQQTKQGDTFSVSPDAKRLEHTAPNNSKRSNTNDFYSLTLDYDLGGHTLTSITGYVKNRGSALIDDTELFASVGLPLPQVTRPSSGSDNAKSQELRIASNAGGAFSYVAGVFYQTSKSSGVAKQIDPSGAFGLTDLVDLSTAGAGTEKAIFGDTEYNFGAGWSAGLGARYYRTSTEFQQRGTIFGGPANIPDLTSPNSTLDSSDSGVTPKATVKYRFGENQWYALASKGYRYGGVNGTPPFKTYKSDSLWNYETGVRLNAAPGLQVDLTAFLLDWKDAQFTYFVLNGALPESGIDNVGKARSLGLEVASRYRVSSSLDFAGSLAYIDARTKADVNIPRPAAPGQPQFRTVASGAALPGTPKLQAALQGNFSFAGPMESQGRFSATYTHVGDRVMFLGGNKPAAAFDTLDLGLNFTSGNWTVATALNNVTDEKGVMSITGAPAGEGAFAQYFLQRPRTLSVSLRYDY